MQFRYQLTGKWFKGNIHIHSKVSDGGKNFIELSELYASAKYDFLFRTDHWVASAVSSDKNSYPLLWIDGIELDGMDSTGQLFHILCLGKIEGLYQRQDLPLALQLVQKQNVITILAHPFWCGNSFEDTLKWHFDGIEVYNHVCNWLNGKGNGLVHWNAALIHNPNILAFAVDDVHLTAEHPGWNGGWIMVNAPECTSAAIINNIRTGNFYSTSGPEIHSLSFDGEKLHVEMSPIRFARLVGPRSYGMRTGGYDTFIENASFLVPAGKPYLYLELEDQYGRKAWTNTLFI